MNLMKLEFALMFTKFQARSILSAVPPVLIENSVNSLLLLNDLFIPFDVSITIQKAEIIVFLLHN